LFNTICEAAGDSVKSAFNEELKKCPTSSVIAVDAGSSITPKKIYFLKWTKNGNEDLLRKSLKKFVSDATVKAVDEKYKSIAFPAIGCGKLGCPINVVAEAMVEEAHHQSINKSISVLFVIQPGKNDVYDEFQKQISLVQQHLPASNEMASRVGKGIIQIETGDITTQKVRLERFCVLIIYFFFYSIGGCYCWKFIVNKFDTSNSKSSW
jgi:hypothetical protein